MKNKGYYGWIHSLNEAGVQAQRNGFEILTEQRVYKGEMLTEANKPNRSEAGMAAKKARSLVDSEKRRAARTAAAESASKAASSGEGDLSDFDFKGFQDRVADVRAEKQAAGSGVQRVETGFHGADEVDDSYDPTDPDSGTEELPYGKRPDYGMDAERALTAQLAQQQDRTSKPRDVNQDGIANAQDSEADGADWEINGLAPDAKFMRRRVQPRFAPRTESVSHKISKMLRN